MLETYFSAAKMLGHLRSGPSGPYLDGFAAALEQQGYGTNQTPISKDVIRLSWKPFLALEPR